MNDFLFLFDCQYLQQNYDKQTLRIFLRDQLFQQSQGERIKSDEQDLKRFEKKCVLDDTRDCEKSKENIRRMKDT